MTEQQQKIDWKPFENQEDNRIKIEVGKKYELGFNSIKQDTIEVVDHERSEEGKMEVKKHISVLILGVDYMDGKPLPKPRELMVSSKRLAQAVRTYVEKNLLFSRVFQLEKMGQGFQTNYSLAALQDKPAATPSGGPSPEKNFKDGVEAFL